MYTLVLGRDPVMKRLMKKHTLTERPVSENIYADLVETVIGQQLSEKAASTIFNRFMDLFHHSFPSPATLVATPDEQLRSCGVSGAKSRYIKYIAQAILDGALDVKQLHKLPDELIMKKLTSIKGVGPWTAEMILMFSLARPDVFSFGDVGLQAAMAKLYGIERGDRVAMERISDTWRPYRSFACRYLWKSIDEI